VGPVLLDDASMPDTEKLPDDLTSIIRWSSRSFAVDADVALSMRKLGVPRPMR
jgi:hypothetical protein